MAYLDDLKKELKKRNISYGTEKSSGAMTTAPESFTSQLHTALKKRGVQLTQAQERSLTGGLTEDEKYPVLTGTGVENAGTGSAEKEKSEPLFDFLQAGTFEDGWQFGDVAKAILGTTGDALLQAGKGALGMAEGLGDLVAYGVARIADLVGMKNGAENIRNAAKRSSVEEMTAGADEWINDYSNLGQTSKAVAQGLGQLGVLAATGGAASAAGLGEAAQSALTLGTMGLSSTGSGMSEAYSDGATDGEALAYGVIAGAAETISEMMFGGLGKGVNALGFNKGLLDADDLIAKKVSSIFKSQLAKNVSELGVKAAGEGLEEVVSGVLSSFGKKLTYMDEESLGKILQDENLLEEFIVGGITSAIAQTPGMVKSTKAGTDMVTGQTKNEQTVIEHEVQSRIEVQEKETGKKATSKEKSNIRADVERDLERGYITTDNIEQALGGEDWKAYKDAADSEKAIADELAELGKKKDATLEEQTRYKELLEQDKANKENSKAEELKRKLSEKVSEMAMEDRVGEAYNEKYRRKQAFQADVAQYDEKHRSTIQNAIDSGILNNTNRSHEFVDLVAKISADTGTAFDFANNAKLKESGFALEGKTVNGVVTADGVVLNMDSAKALNTVVGHEVTHILEGTELYDGLKDALFEYAKTKGDFDSRRTALEQLYKDIEGADIDSELVADLAGDYLFTDESFIRELSTAHRNVFQKLFDEIKRLCKLATAGSKEARELEKVKQTFEKAYREAGQATKNTADGGGVKYSLAGVNEYGIEVYETSDEIMGMSWNERKARYLEVMRNEYRGRTAKFERNGHTYYAQFDQNSIRKHIYGDSRASTNGVKALTKAGADGDVFTLVENADYTGSKQNTKNHTNADYFDYYVKTVQIDGKVFDLRADVEKQYGADGGYVYTLALRESKKTKAAPALGTPQSGPVKGAETASSDSISNSGQNVNTKYSLSPEGEGGGGETGGYNVYGEDIQRLDWNDLAPDPETGPLTGDDIAPTMEEIARQEAEKVKSQAPGDLEAQLEVAKRAYEDAARESDILFDKYNRGEITDQEFQSRYKEMEQRLLALENQRDYLQNEVDQKARADSYTDEDVPLDPKWRQKTATDTNQTKATKPVAESKPIIAKKELRSTIMDLFSIADGTKNEIGSVIDSYADRLLKKGSLTEADRKAFFERMYESGMVTVAADEYYQQARQYIKGGRIYVDQNTILELGDNWSDIRRKAFAAGVYLTSDSRYRNAGIDVWNQELATELPGLFSAEDTDLRSILENIVRVAEEGKAQKMSLAEYTESLAGRGTAMEAEIMDHLEREMDQALRTFAEKAKLEIKLRDRTGVKIAQERQARAEAQQRARDRKELSELQQKTLKSLQWLNKNRNRAPAELKAKYDEVLSDIDIYAVGAANEMRWSSKYEATYRDLAQIYQDAKTSDTNFLPSKELEKIVARLNNRKIADMDIDALNDLYKAATALRTEFYNRNNVINDDMHRLFSEVYGESKTEIENAPGKYSGKMLDKLFNLDQLTPMNVLQRMAGWNPNSTFYSMAKQLEQGARDVRAYKVKAARQLETFLTENKDLVSRMDGQGKNAIWYEIEVPELSQLQMGDKPIFGKTVTIKFTPSQKIHMYLESKNADNLRHMTGGRTFADPNLYSQGKRQEAFAQGTTVRLAPETVKQIVSDLTPKELELAGILEKYYNVFAKEEINKVSNPLYGYDKAMGNYYAPIVSNQNYTQTEFGEFDVKAENVGHLKGRNYAKNPSYNIGCFDAFERHMDQTARFVGMAIPTRNWQALMNWQSGGKSTADVITHKWGQEGKKYITDLITDLQGGKMETTESVSSGVSKLESNYISAVFGANPSIVMKQLGSIPLAGTYLGMNNFPSVSQIKNIDTDLIGIYTPDLQWRTMGYSMPETKTLKESQNWTQKNKVVEFTMGGGAITAMDGWAASTLWPWAENKVRREHPELEIGTSEQIQKGESPFYKAVAAEFENAVARSQSTSEDIYQSTLRKSKNAFAKAFTMFRSDSAQTYNAIRQKIGEYKYYAKQGDTAAAKKAKSCIGTAMATAIGGYMWAEGIELLMNLWKHKGKKYRDDDDELTAESVAKEVTIGLVGDMAGIVVGGEEVAELIGNVLTGEKWYGIDTMGMEQLNDFFEGIANAGSGIRDLVAEGGNILDQGGDLGEYFSSHSKDILGGAKNLAEVAATYLGGVPVTNLEAYLLGLVKWVSPELNTAYEDALESVNKSNLSGLTGGSLAVRVESVLSDRNIDAGDETAKVLAGLYEAGYKTAIPSNAPTSISIDGEAVQLSAYEQQLYGNIWSNAVSGGLDELTSSQAFANADQKTQAKMLSDLYSYATERAKAGVAEEYEVQSGTAKAAAVSKAVPLAQYMAVRAVANGMEPDKDSDGNTITGSKKEKVVAYINDLDDLEYGEKIILYRSLYSGDNTYNGEIVEYLNGRADISYDQMVEILLALGFRISDDGNKVYWD